MGILATNCALAICYRSLILLLLYSTYNLQAQKFNFLLVLGNVHFQHLDNSDMHSYGELTGM